jgi:hypothetical protein
MYFLGDEDETPAVKLPPKPGQKQTPASKPKPAQKKPDTSDSESDSSEDEKPGN